MERVSCTRGVVGGGFGVGGGGGSWSYVLDRDVEVCRKGWSYVCCVGRVGRTCGVVWGGLVVRVE